jgi:hypothetical protein
MNQCSLAITPIWAFIPKHHWLPFLEEAKRNIREAIQQHLQSLLAHHQPVPQNEKLVHVEELTVAVP